MNKLNIKMQCKELLKQKLGNLGSDPGSAGGPLAHLFWALFSFLENKKIVLENPKISLSSDIPQDV